MESSICAACGQVNSGVPRLRDYLTGGGGWRGVRRGLGQEGKEEEKPGETKERGRNRKGLE